MFSSLESPDLAPTVEMKGELRPHSVAVRSQEKCGLTEEQVLHVLEQLRGYLRGQRIHYLPFGKPLGSERVGLMSRFFSPSLLSRIKVVQLVNRRITAPSFCQEIRASGFPGLKEFTHGASMTFEDLLVFNDIITDRLLFHALVRSVQFQVLGLDRYAELFVRAFLDTRLRFGVPLERHAFELDSRFAADRKTPFSVEEEVRMRASEHHYESASGHGLKRSSARARKGNR
jgi:hypothetical protein